MNSTAEAELFDAIIIGGGAAGLSAAQSLGRALRRTLILDAGEPRNRFADQMHNILGHDGASPDQLVAAGRKEAQRYGVEHLTAGVHRVSESTRTDSTEKTGPRELVVTLDSGVQLFTRTVIAASGLTDELPPIPGLAERWGKSVLHCPYCHGWEVRGQRLAVLATSPMQLHQAQLLRQWSDRLTYFHAGAGELTAETAARLRSRGVVLEPAPVKEVLGDGTRVTGVVLEDSRTLEVDAIFTGGSLIPRDAYLRGLGLEREDTMVGSFLKIDAMGQTSHDRIWAAGNLASPMATVPLSMGMGSFAGAAANGALVAEEFDLAEAGRNQ
ncbi:oxidoreductase [Nesterenkonia sp. AN1]|uniref:Thioredoxin reductase n=1 Tax=Nesterenkonia aurantiaca TaxID=1436010 RepID=A0A4R7G411_9MICC|nr:MULTISPECIES: NAD(P)/FAD-dependent oxidoreductase [Nesterenkonia]EXF24492.1 oxidoreductase [Nesterenkonia sp. AN1]TDS86133.1 thioredoxin reductase [Nesterenkonia aurantiaca]